MAGNWGGKRPGAGRKRGSPDKVKAAQEVVQAAKARYAEKFGDDDWNEMTPLEVILMGMKLALKDNDWDTGINRAQVAAPYVHPKLASQEIKATVTNNLADLSDAELDAIEEILLQGGEDGTDHGTAH
jgi:hypothetical protein